MARKMKVSVSARVALLAAHRALTADVDELREEWDNHSEAWQESDRGTGAEAWLANLENVADVLGEALLEPDGDSLDSLT